VFVFGFVILSIQYYVDRFSLFRLWGWNAQLGAEVPTFSRKYMILGCLAVFAIVSSFVFGQFPYDNVCDPPDPLVGVEGVYTKVSLGNGLPMNKGSASEGIAIVTQKTSVVFCDQSRVGSDQTWFPVTNRVQGDGPTWFTEDQVSSFVNLLDRIRRFRTLLICVLSLVGANRCRVWVDQCGHCSHSCYISVW
jgi:hypothetical protein